ncbi:uncharacterized protein LOC115562993 [Drosophila navojoa]|uniref:uncharacterized protein LOC115562993 n=1 Tax=Drosophila navojoa TaxID=7232 RepID=UPI0011BFC8F6|nr:uncharacterized protein LOC115562993 [Drosophila navojoa]
MLFQIKFQYAIFGAILFTWQSSALKYLFVPEDDQFYSECQNSALNVLNVHEMSDMSELTFTREDDKITVLGNASFKWNIQPGDRVLMSFQLFKFDRISWVQTPFGMTIADICPILFDKPQYWYKYWTQYITNKEDVKSKCFYPGSKFIHEPFVINLIFDVTGLPLHGRHKIVVTIRAFNWMNMERETSICIELLGEFERLN